MSNKQNAKKLVQDYYSRLDSTSYNRVEELLVDIMHPEVLWRGYHPFNEQVGPKAVAEKFWGPLKKSISHMQRRMDIFIAGDNKIEGYEGVWVASMGHLMGLFDSPWLDITATKKIMMLRYGEFNHVKDHKIVETAMFFDIPHFMIQAGFNPFPPQTGAHLVQPGPMTHDGLIREPVPERESQKTLNAIEFMIEDSENWSGGREEPLLDELRRSWNEDMIWWGPTGIGATYTLERYAQQHSGPFREGFTNRQFNGHICRIAEGAFGGFFGWPNLTLTPTGGFMGMPACGKPADMRVIDFYRRDGDKLTENWIFIDFLHFWKMQGLDVLKRMKETNFV